MKAKTCEDMSGHFIGGPLSGKKILHDDDFFRCPQMMPREMLNQKDYCYSKKWCIKDGKKYYEWR